jgi:elongator complex protein 2
MTITNEFISGSANTLGNKGVIWVKVDDDEDNKGFVAYPMFNSIAIVDMSNEKLICSIRGYQGKITSLTYISSFDKIELISGSEDGIIRIYKSNYSQTGSFMDWEEINILKGLKGSITCLSTFYSIQLGSIIAASDVLGNICLWWRINNEIEYNIIEEIKLPSIQMANDLHLADISHRDEINNNIQNLIALIIGGVDSKIQIRVSSISDDNIPSKFLYMGSLIGHEEWVTCLASTRVDNSNILLASGSQDSKIRVWGISISPKSPLNSNANVSLSDSSIPLSNNDDDEDGDNIIDEGAVQILPEEIVGEARLVFEIQNLVYSIFFNAILFGHEEWVTSVNWMKKATSINSNSNTSEIALFSTSMDRNMIIWKVSIYIYIYQSI